MLTGLDNADKHRTVQPAWISAGLSAHPKGMGIVPTSTTDAALYDGAEIGRWHFASNLPPLPPEMKMEGYFPIQVSLREPFFATGVRRMLGNFLTAVTIVLDMFEPSIAHGAPPAPLKYWDGPDWISG